LKILMKVITYPGLTIPSPEENRKEKPGPGGSWCKNGFFRDGPKCPSTAWATTPVPQQELGNKESKYSKELVAQAFQPVRG
jgi:hypothetical protein